MKLAEKLVLLKQWLIALTLQKETVPHILVMAVEKNGAEICHNGTM